MIRFLPDLDDPVVFLLHKYETLSFYISIHNKAGRHPAKTGKPSGLQLLFQFKGTGVKLIISAFFGNQLLMVSAFDNASMIKYHYNI